MRSWRRAAAGLHTACEPVVSLLYIWKIGLRKNYKKVVADIRVCKT